MSKHQRKFHIRSHKENTASICTIVGNNANSTSLQLYHTLYKQCRISHVAQSCSNPSQKANKTKLVHIANYYHWPLQKSQKTDAQPKRIDASPLKEMFHIGTTYSPLLSGKVEACKSVIPEEQAGKVLVHQFWKRVSSSQHGSKSATLLFFQEQITG